jgi:cold shock CspA family protein
MTGRLRFYDGPTAWGVVVGDDGQLYMVHGQPASGAPLRVGERVRFEPSTGPGGLRATGVQRLDGVKGPPATGAR